MYAGKIVFAQVIEHLPIHTFRRCVQRYRDHCQVQSFSCLDLDASLYTVLQSLSVTVFEKTPIIQILTHAAPATQQRQPCSQLNLFD